MTKTLAFLAGLWSVCLFAQDATLLAPGDALSPEEQRVKFHLPPGFEIQLVASEPEIGQPMNLQFDASGRLWVTSSVEYPYPAEGPGVEARDENFAGSDEPHPPRDWVAVLSGIGSDGKPAKITRFKEGLNIPIGHLPLEDGALVYSIPSLDRYADVDGDGVADERKPLITGFGNVDTHGMCNGLRRWIDGWVYASHGFRNTSHLKGADGRELTMNSGNTFRFRPDGTVLEQYTWGEVNPFGLAFDPLGNLYSADCHSMPLTCLLRGAYYQSFGKPHDGLGFGPNMIDHSHGSTGICGPAYYAATQFPEDYRDNLFLCNPVTGRVHRDKLVWHGSSPHVDTQPDFITCDDGWFRPVDLAVGPDGALYLADFYNAIIGHYEMPLGHPKRDRSKGRVWRIAYVGKDGDGGMLPGPPDLTDDSVEELVALLGDENLHVRVTATHELVDRHGDQVVPMLKTLLERQSETAAEVGVADARRAHAMWVLERLDALELGLLKRLSKDESRLVRTHVAKLIAERETWSNGERMIAISLLMDDDPFVQRASVDASGRHGDLSMIRPLLAMLKTAPADDTHLIHTIRIAIRNLLTRSDEVIAAADLKAYTVEDLRIIAGIVPAVKTEMAAGLLGALLKLDAEEGATIVAESERTAAFGHVMRYGDEGTRVETIGFVRETSDDQQEVALLEVARSALQQRGEDPGVLLEEWGTAVATRLLKESSKAIGWVAVSGGSDGQAWTKQERSCADGAKGMFWSSLPNGEQRTGILRSEVFSAPERLGFFVAGHSGFPDKEAHRLNSVRLRDAATGIALREALPPRNDTAREVDWDLREVSGRAVYLELEDGDTGKAYAWLAVGRFSVEGLNFDRAAGPGRAAELITALKLRGMLPELREMLSQSDRRSATRVAAATAIIGLEENAILAALVPLMDDPATAAILQDEIAAAALSRDAMAVANAVALAFKTLPGGAQLPLAERLSATPLGADALLTMIEQGHASARLLMRPTIKERITVHGDQTLSGRIEVVTADLPAEDEAIRTLITQRTEAFDFNKVDAERGVAVFAKNCANCHRIGAEGSLVGPQLDGIGVRGLARVAEDVLDPNRNVDGAFKTTTLVLADGRVVTGLVRREEGESIVLADNAGKEFSVPKADVEEQVSSPLSLMPANFGEAIPAEQFADLMAYLLSQKQAK